MTGLKTISPARAAELIPQGAVLIDIREADEHNRERIPGARHHALSQIDNNTPARDGDDVLVYHCRSGGRTPGNAARFAAASSACETSSLDGGLAAWKKVGLSITHLLALTPCNRRTFVAAT